MGRRARPLVLLASFAAFVAACAFASRVEAEDAQGSRKVDFAKDVKPALQKFCLGCHSGKNAPANLDLSIARSDTDLQKNDKDWERVIRALQSNHMPPETAAQPSQEQRDEMVHAMQSIITGNCTLQDPGRVTIRRLNRTEYANTIRDLMGVEFKASDDFPNDDVGYGFDNIADVLSISPLLMDKYLDAAEAVAAQAIATTTSRTVQYESDKLSQAEGTAQTIEGDRGYSVNATCTVEHTIVDAGAYRIKILASGNQAGSEPCKMLVSWDGKPLQTFNVPVTPDRPSTYEAPIEGTPGKHLIGIAFTNDYYEPTNPDPSRRDRNLMVRTVEVVGPLGGVGNYPETTRRIIPHPPSAGKEVETAREFLSAFASRAYRRPVKPEEIEALVRIFKVASDNKETFNRSMQVAVSAVLVSPAFLFRSELDPPGTDAKGRLLNGYEIASRLSYFLWSTMPDVDLMKLASEGKLNEPKAIEAQVDRMLRDPKAQALGTSFASQWLQLKKLNVLQPDPRKFAVYKTGLKQLMLQQALMFFNDVVANDRSILEFLDSKETFLNTQLAAFYDIPGVSSNEMRRVAIDKPERGGLLGMGAILTLTSNPTRTSPTKRGKWILEQVLGTPPPPPPPGVGELKPAAPNTAPATLREQLEEHRRNPDCAGCHSRMDPLGFSLENFDPIGQWRYKDDQKVNIDATGELPGGVKFSGPVELRGLLMAKKDVFARALAEKLMIYGLGRGVTLRDDCALDDVVKKCKESGYKFSAIVKAIVLSDAFRKRRSGEGK